MLKASFKVAFFKKSISLFEILSFVLISYFSFLALNIKMIKVVQENAYFYINSENVSLMFAFSALFFSVVMLLESYRFEKIALESIHSLNVLNHKKIIVYDLSKLILSLISIPISIALCVLTLILVDLNLNGSLLGINYKFLNLVLPFVLVILFSIIFSMFNQYIFYRKNVKIDLSFVPYVLFLIDAFTFIFALNNAFFAATFYFLLIPLIAYAVLKICDYLEIFRKNSSNKKRYSFLFFKRTTSINFVVIIVLSFVVIVSSFSNIKYNNIKVKNMSNYFNYDLELALERDSEKEVILYNESEIQYLFSSKEMNASYNNYNFIVYKTDLTMISEFSNISVIDGKLRNEVNQIALPQYFKINYGVNVGDKINVSINNEVYELEVSAILGDTSEIISYVYYVSNLKANDEILFVNFLNNDYKKEDLYSVLGVEEDTSYMTANQKYYGYINTIRTTTIFISVLMIILLIIVYIGQRVMYYKNNKDFIYELNEMPIRKYQVKRIIYSNNYLAMFVSLITFYFIQFMLNLFYHPTSNNIYFFFFKNLNMLDILLCLIISFLVYNITLLAEFAIYNYGEIKYEEK